MTYHYPGLHNPYAICGIINNPPKPSSSTVSKPPKGTVLDPKDSYTAPARRDSTKYYPIGKPIPASSTYKPRVTPPSHVTRRTAMAIAKAQAAKPQLPYFAAKKQLVAEPESKPKRVVKRDIGKPDQCQLDELGVSAICHYIYHGKLSAHLPQGFPELNAKVVVVVKLPEFKEDRVASDVLLNTKMRSNLKTLKKKSGAYIPNTKLEILKCFGEFARGRRPNLDKCLLIALQFFTSKVIHTFHGAVKEVLSVQLHDFPLQQMLRSTNLDFDLMMVQDFEAWILDIAIFHVRGPSKELGWEAAVFGANPPYEHKDVVIRRRRR